MIRKEGNVERDETKSCPDERFGSRNESIERDDKVRRKEATKPTSKGRRENLPA
jgi:hypothetical protein